MAKQRSDRENHQGNDRAPGGSPPANDVPGTAAGTEAGGNLNKAPEGPEKATATPDGNEGGNSGPKAPEGPLAASKTASEAPEKAGFVPFEVPPVGHFGPLAEIEDADREKLPPGVDFWTVEIPNVRRGLIAARSEQEAISAFFASRAIVQSDHMPIVKKV